MSTTSRTTRATLTREELAAHLEALLEGVRQGSVILDNEHHPLILRPSDSISMTLDCRRKGFKEYLELRLAWLPGDRHGLVHTPADDPSHSEAGEHALAEADGEYAEPPSPGRFEDIAPSFVTPPGGTPAEPAPPRPTSRLSSHIRIMSAALKDALLSGDDIGHASKAPRTPCPPQKK